jgi:hypothetical protein
VAKIRPNSKNSPNLVTLYALNKNKGLPRWTSDLAIHSRIFISAPFAFSIPDLEFYISGKVKGYVFPQNTIFVTRDNTNRKDSISQIVIWHEFSVGRHKIFVL